MRYGEHVLDMFRLYCSSQVLERKWFSMDARSRVEVT